ncbi:MAG: glycosidase, partial [Bryobacteraceae bacterium]|nr:glycosidase [Bryobacteraceae bacterium]
MLALERDPLVLNPDQSRLLLRPFNSSSPERVAHIVARVLALPEAEVEALLVAVTAEFSARHH